MKAKFKKLEIWYYNWEKITILKAACLLPIILRFKIWSALYWIESLSRNRMESCADKKIVSFSFNWKIIM
jgi:hypothetical protein